MKICSNLCRKGTCHDHTSGVASRGEYYLIRVKGHLGPELASWFDGLTVSNQPNGEAVLGGLIPDQAALHGTLGRIRDLGLPLLAVYRVDPIP